MTFHARVLRRSPTFALLVPAAMLLASEAAIAQPPQAITVPAFFSITQKHDNATPDWMRIVNAGAVAKIVVAGLDTLGSGSGPPA